MSIEFNLLAIRAPILLLDARKVHAREAPSVKPLAAADADASVPARPYCSTQRVHFLMMCYCCCSGAHYRLYGTVELN